MYICFWAMMRLALVGERIWKLFVLCDEWTLCPRFRLRLRTVVGDVMTNGSCVLGFVCGCGRCYDEWILCLRFRLRRMDAMSSVSSLANGYASSVFVYGEWILCPWFRLCGCPVQVASPYRYTALGWYRDKFGEEEDKKFQVSELNRNRVRGKCHTRCVHAKSQRRFFGI